MFQWKENVLFMKISQAISRTTGPNIGLFVFILMHFSCWCQISLQNLTILKILIFFFFFFFLVVAGTHTKDTLEGVKEVERSRYEPRMHHKFVLGGKIRFNSLECLLNVCLLVSPSFIYKVHSTFRMYRTHDGHLKSFARNC